MANFYTIEKLEKTTKKINILPRPDAQLMKSRLLRHILREPGNYLFYGQTDFDKKLADEFEKCHYIPPLSDWNPADYMVAEFETINDDTYIMIYVCDLNRDYLISGGFSNLIKNTDMIEFMIVMNSNIVKDCNRINNNECILCGGDYGEYGHNPAPLGQGGRCCDKCNSQDVLPARLKNYRLATMKAEGEKEPEKPKEECCICLDEFVKCKWRCSTCNAGLICKGCHTKMKGVRKCPVCRTAPRHNKKK
jgi:hypothetical protein